jgi:hypothetical protein
MSGMISDLVGGVGLGSAWQPQPYATYALQALDQTNPYGKSLLNR